MSTTTQRPNIIFYNSNLQRADSCGCFGQKQEVTPVLDELAKNGVKFNNAYSTCPSVPVMRAIFQTGKLPLETGIYRSYLPLPKDGKTVASILTEAGYETGFIGNWGLASHCPDMKKPLEGTDLREEPVPVELRGGFTGFWRAADDLNATSDLFKGHVFDENNEKVEMEGYRNDRLTDFALEFLSKQDKNKPFFLSISIGEPLVARASEVDNLTKKVNTTGSRVISPDTMIRYKFLGCEVPVEVQLFAGVYRADYANYLAQCFVSDRNLGRLIEKLKESGQWDNTIIIFTSPCSNSFGARNHDSHFNGFDDFNRSAHKDCSRVPLVIGGGAIKEAKEIEHLVSTTSLARTILELAGQSEQAQDMCGNNLLEVKEGPLDDSDELLYFISESRVGRALRTKNFLYAIYAPKLNGLEAYQADDYLDDYMYDSINDMYEDNNIMAAPHFKEEKLKMRERLCELLEQSEGKKPHVEDGFTVIEPKALPKDHPHLNR